MPTIHTQAAPASRRTLLVSNSRPQARPHHHSARHQFKSPRQPAKPAVPRTLLADFLLNLSEYEIASVQVLSQRLDLLEELHGAPGRSSNWKHRARALRSVRVKIRNKQKFLRA